MMKRVPLSACLVAAVFLSACAAEGTYPSLAKRPFETGGTVPPPPPAPPTAPSDQALLARVASAVKDAKDGGPAFENALGAAKDAVKRASGTAEGSEPWIAGQMAVSRLERTLEPAQSALSSLDEERRLVQQNPNSPDLPAIQAAIDDVQAIEDRQSASVKELVAMLSGG